MSKIKVDNIATRTGSGNITFDNNVDLTGRTVTGAGIIGTSNLATSLDLTGKVATGHQTLSDHVATTSFNAVGYTSSSNFVTLGSITIPKPGIWRVSTQLRLRWGSNAYFVKMYLTESSQTGSSGTIADEIYASGGSANSNSRMLFERISVNSFGNLLLEPTWIVDIPLGSSSGDTIYFSVSPSGADSQALNNSDANGRIGAVALKIAETTTTGTTPTTRSF